MNLSYQTTLTITKCETVRVFFYACRHVPPITIIHHTARKMFSHS